MLKEYQLILLRQEALNRSAHTFGSERDWIQPLSVTLAPINAANQHCTLPVIAGGLTP